MSNVLALCDNCGYIGNSGVGISNSSDIFIVNSPDMECPNCGEWKFKTIDGLYNEIENVMSIVAIDDGRELEKLYNILKGVTKDTTINELENKLKEDTPQYLGIMDKVREWSDKNANVIAISSILMNILFFIYSNSYEDNQTEDYKNILEQQQNINKQQQEIIKEQNKIIDEDEEDDKKE